MSKSTKIHSCQTKQIIENLDDQSFITPRKQILKRKFPDDQLPNKRSLTPILIPPSPSMKHLGYGTGVNVYLIERFSPLSGCYKSPWAVKKMNSTLQPEHEFCQRLRDEAKILKSLKHPNIIGFRSYTKNDKGNQCLVMESGEKSLSSYIDNADINKSGPLTVEQIYKVVESIASALDYLHTDKKILHGDLKSANILIKGEFKSVKLCDFGVTLKLQDDLTVDPQKYYYIGTECWSAPEAIIGGLISNKTDIFSLGLVIWEMIALTAPHVDKLTVDNENLLDKETLAKLEAENEIEFQQVLGTRPPLPDHSLSEDYNKVLELFYFCTEEKSSMRPSANEILKLFLSSNP